MTTHHIDKEGKLLRATSDPNRNVPGAVMTTEIAPADGRAIWDGNGWVEPDPMDSPETFEDLVRLVRLLTTQKQRADVMKERGKPL